MAISRKPMSKPIAAIDVEALIQKGGSSAAVASAKSQNGPAPIVLRLPNEMLERIDALVKARPVRIPRHTWLLEAVYEKLARDTHE